MPHLCARCSLLDPRCGLPYAATPSTSLKPSLPRRCDSTLRPWDRGGGDQLPELVGGCRSGGACEALGAVPPLGRPGGAGGGSWWWESMSGCRATSGRGLYTLDVGDCGANVQHRVSYTSTGKMSVPIART